MIKVAAAIIQKDNKVLIAKRKAGDKLANKWEFPGGKIEKGETPEECLVREIYEEFEINISVTKFFSESIYSYEHLAVHLLAYFAKWERGIIIPKVHDEFRWVTIDELNNYDFAPADIPLVQKLKRRGINGI
ncbi:MAG: 8-oxo-dGTP diphosphatase MutT [Desulfotomaculum sp.]|nr:8-oxo-dGTP diphosphatase MutT [Desulfotomaculum sp.]